MIGRFLKSSVHILIEVISFLLLIPVLIISCSVLLVTGKLEAFALRSKKEKKILIVKEEKEKETLINSILQPNTDL